MVLRAGDGGVLAREALTARRVQAVAVPADAVKTGAAAGVVQAIVIADPRGAARAAVAIVGAGIEAACRRVRAIGDGNRLAPDRGVGADALIAGVAFVRAVVGTNNRRMRAGMGGGIAHVGSAEIAVRAILVRAAEASINALGSAKLLARGTAH